MLDAGGDGDLELLSVRDVSKLGWDEKEGQWRTFEESVTSDEADGAYTTCATDFVGDADLDVIGDILTRDGAPTSSVVDRDKAVFRSAAGELGPCPGCAECLVRV